MIQLHPVTIQPCPVVIQPHDHIYNSARATSMTVRCGIHNSVYTHDSACACDSAHTHDSVLWCICDSAQHTHDLAPWHLIQHYTLMTQPSAAMIRPHSPRFIQATHSIVVWPQEGSRFSPMYINDPAPHTASHDSGPHSHDSAPYSHDSAQHGHNSAPHYHHWAPHHHNSAQNSLHSAQHPPQHDLPPPPHHDSAPPPPPSHDSVSPPPPQPWFSPTGHTAMIQPLYLFIFKGGGGGLEGKKT